MKNLSAWAPNALPRLEQLSDGESVDNATLELVANWRIQDATDRPEAGRWRRSPALFVSRFLLLIPVLGLLTPHPTHFRRHCCYRLAFAVSSKPGSGFGAGQVIFHSLTQPCDGLRGYGRNRD